MTSVDMEVKFMGNSPHIKELMKLVKENGFSNIEDMKWLRTDKNGNATYWLSMNDRATEQKEFKVEIVGGALADYLTANSKLNLFLFKG